MRTYLLVALVVAIAALTWHRPTRADVAVPRRARAFVDLLTTPVSMTVITQASGTEVAPIYVNRTTSPVIVSLTYGTYPHHGIGSVGLSVSDHIKLYRNVTEEVASNMANGGASGGSGASIELAPGQTLHGQCTTATWSFTLMSVKLGPIGPADED